MDSGPAPFSCAWSVPVMSVLRGDAELVRLERAGGAVAGEGSAVGERRPRGFEWRDRRVGWLWRGAAWPRQISSALRAASFVRIANRAWGVA